KLKEVEDLVADLVEVNVPFNNYITGFCAFTHKAGIHAKAILANPSTYEIIDPADFGISRYIHFASRLTGWNAIKSRAQQLNIEMTDAQYKECTAAIKRLADIRPIAIDDADSVIHAFHRNVKMGKTNPANVVLPNMTEKERLQLEEKEREDQKVPEKRRLDETVAEEVETEQIVKKARTNGVMA
ncbi:MAG: Saccharopine dehydrogenase, partial [Watsoniomyces obsoletus]